MPTDLPEPSKLFRVQRFAPLKHRIYWERKILFELGLIHSVSTEHINQSNVFNSIAIFYKLFQKSDVSIVKNTPENNVLLWKVKHLITVEPITFPYGEPTEDDIKYTKLQENGECIVHKKIGVDDRSIEETEKFINDPVKLDKDTLKREALLKWVRCY